MQISAACDAAETYCASNLVSCHVLPYVFFWVFFCSNGLLETQPVGRCLMCFGGDGRHLSCNARCARCLQAGARARAVGPLIP